MALQNILWGPCLPLRAHAWSFGALFGLFSFGAIFGLLGALIGLSAIMQGQGGCVHTYPDNQGAHSFFFLEAHSSRERACMKPS